MPSTILLSEQKIETANSPKVVDEAVWNAWLGRTAAKDRHKHAFRMEAMRFVRGTFQHRKHDVECASIEQSDGQIAAIPSNGWINEDMGPKPRLQE